MGKVNTVFVTGCSGYVGGRLCRRLKDRGFKVIGLDRDAYEGGDVDNFIRADLCEAAEYAEILRGVDHICHLAAAKGDWGISDTSYFRDNVVATKTLLDAAHSAQVKRWMFFSSVAVLGSSEPSSMAVAETAPLNPINPYGTSKAECERLFGDYVDRYPDASVIMIRPAAVFGPGNPWNTNIFRLTDAIHRDRFVMIGGGDAIKATAYITNLIDAHMFLMTRQIAEEHSGCDVFHYVDEPPETTLNLVATIYRLLGKQQNGVRLPLWFASNVAKISDIVSALTRVDLPITSARIETFCRPTNYSASAIRRLGFIQSVSNEDALKETVDWYLKDYKSEPLQDFTEAGKLPKKAALK